MYGSIFRMRPIAGKTQELKDIFLKEGHRPAGMKNAFMLTEDADGSVWGMGVFEDEKAYRDNASDPAQDARYQRFRALLQADPEWHDGSIEQMPS